MSTEPSHPAVAARNLTKVYLRHFHDARSLKEILLFRSHRGEREPLVALRDVTFDVQPGEMVGVVGMNGAGKSSLLKMMAGITPPTAGEIKIHGRIGSLLELGAGFQPDLSGMENIFLNASVMGIPREEVEAALEPIIDFAGLRRFIHTPVKHYSTGMYVRLGFGAAVHMRPDILLIDEVLSVGDSEFQVRSFQRLFELRERGVAGLLVSHDLHTLEALCDRLLWIEHGEVQALGATPEVLRAYRRHLQGDVDLPALREASVDAIRMMPQGRVGSGEVAISAVRILSSDEHPTQTLVPGEPVTVEIDCVAKQRVEDADVVLTIEHEGLRPAMIRGSDHGFRPVFGPGRHLIRVRFEECLLNLGSYRLSVALMKDDDIYRFYDHHIRLHSFAVHSPLPSSLEPLLRIPATFEVTEMGQPKTIASSPSAAQ